jgi:hypothetical protein
MEGEDDLAGILLAIGQELQTFDMSASFVGPFNVANKVADLLLSRRSPSAPPDLKPDPALNSRGSGEEPADLADQQSNSHESPASDSGAADAAKLRSGPVAPSLMDQFARHKFMMDVLDGTAGSAEISGVIALVLGFKLDVTTGTWSAQDVSDPFFAKFASGPPQDILADDESLMRLESRFREGDDDGRVAEGLDVVVETYHGSELTKIQREAGDDDFRRREIVAKYLHMFGGF